MAVLVVAIVGLVSAILATTRLRQLNSEQSAARNEAERVLSAVRGMQSVRDAYARFGGGGSQETFDVHGLSGPSAGERPGRVIVWRRKSSLTNRAAPPQPDPLSALAIPAGDLLEAQASFSGSFPAPLDAVAGVTGTAWDDYFDTDGDGAYNSLDDPRLMPVTVRIRWRSRSAVVTKYFSTVVCTR